MRPEILCQIWAGRFWFDQSQGFKLSLTDWLTEWLTDRKSKCRSPSAHGLWDLKIKIHLFSNIHYALRRDGINVVQWYCHTVVLRNGITVIQWYRHILELPYSCTAIMCNCQPVLLLLPNSASSQAKLEGWVSFNFR